MIRTPAVQPLLVARLHLARQDDSARQQRAIRAAMPDPDYRTVIESEGRLGFVGARVTASDVFEDAAADTMKGRGTAEPVRARLAVRTVPSRVDDAGRPRRADAPTADATDGRATRAAR